MDIRTNIWRQPESLADVRRHLAGPGAAELATACAVIRGARRVIFTGMGGSLYALMPAATYLAEHGILVNVHDAGELLYYGAVPEDAVVVALSRSGRTAETARLAAEWRARGVPVVGVTNCAVSPLAEASDAVLRVAGDLDDGVSIQTYTAGVATGLALAAALAGTTDAFVTAFSGALDRLPQSMNTWQQEALGWRLGDARHVVFLGRGYSVSSACESALLMQELARRTATWYNAAEFRQGPVEALRPDHAVVVFAPEGATRDFSTRLAADLRHTGARVVVAGESLDAPEWLAPALQIIPVQMAAYAIAADAPNTLPGEFRYAAPVSDKEDGLAAG